ncbi:copper chaperone PCu(A)C [Nereida sp. MMG025]|uniref:copper chaperone PCu(A)C n=1 Tax=Nereida sp. MMG025 TaxID=2909981 RepID=UPI001F3E2B86|nr:copper chaperone PCu(A)C [Nereida sp. MMG025]MCF6444027.1 copper chaperone PCu(A)C [Nereida sp. MMG025]
MKQLLLAAALACVTATMAQADINIKDAYARASTPTAKSGAAFMMITNTSDQADRLIGASSDVAKRVELHTHIEKDGVMNMVHIEEGFALEAGETIALERGGKHVMFMGLTQSFDDGAQVPVTLTFEKAGNVEVMVPVDLKRQPKHGMAHGANHGEGDHTN